MCTSYLSLVVNLDVFCLRKINGASPRILPGVYVMILIMYQFGTVSLLCCSLVAKVF